MKKTRYSDEEIARILRQTTRVAITGVARRSGVSEGSIRAWRKRFSGMVSSDTKRLKASA